MRETFAVKLFKYSSIRDIIRHIQIKQTEDYGST